ncbi:MAG: metallophosphoesterase [Lachnospiraceae bacterium]|nr:metallophosphoesterase [Lachnospiraceae bacterium]
MNVISPGVKGGLDTCINWEPLSISAGTRISLKAPGFIFRVFAYKKELPPELIYTSTMPPEGCMMIYDPDASCLNWQDREFTVHCDSYIRLSARSSYGSVLDADLYLDDIFEIVPGPSTEGPEGTGEGPSFMAEELEDTVSKVLKCRREKDFVFIMPADTHYAFGGTWKDTEACIRALAGRIGPDMIVHLGDITDGMMPESLDSMCVKRTDRGLKAAGIPVRYCVGNHDLVSIYSDDIKGYAERKTDLITGGRGAYYYEDLPEKNIRCIYLSAYEPSEEDPYGFSVEEISWLERTLKEMPEGFKALVFTHVSPLLNMVQKSDRVRNASKVMEVLKASYKDRNILGVFAGHSHVDSLDNAGFPVIRTGCAKLEDHAAGSRPLHTGVFTRKAGTASQELLDIAVVHTDTADMDIIRFGKGEDRHAEAE